MAEQTLPGRTLTTPAMVHKKPAFFRSARFQENFVSGVATLLCLAGLIVVLFPAFWMLSTSLKGQIEAPINGRMIFFP